MKARRRAATCDAVTQGAIAIVSSSAKPPRSVGGTLGCENPGARKTKPAQRAKNEQLRHHPT